jgi:ferric-dicitrate binding protein FerR (iron transport regulator)
MERHNLQPEIDGILIGKYLAGEATPEEVISLEDWISGSAKNKLLFEEYMATWHGISKQGGYSFPDKSSAWQRLNERIGAQKRKSAVKKLFTYPVAAVITGLAILSIIFLLMFIKADRPGKMETISFTSALNFKENILPDGSTIVLHTNSSLKFPGKFNKTRREAILDGEGYFKIIPDRQKPFVIQIENISIMVLGTSFNVRKDEQKGTIETQVSSGKIKMFNADGEIFVTAGQTGIYNKNNQDFSLQDMIDINSISYATRRFVFSDESLSSIVKYLEKAYSKKIVLENDFIAKCKMTSSFDNKPIEYILDVIAATLNISYYIKEGIIYIGGPNDEGC